MEKSPDFELNLDFSGFFEEDAAGCSTAVFPGLIVIGGACL